MTTTGGLDVLIAWAIFAALLVALGYFLLRPHPDPTSEAERTAPPDTRATPICSRSSDRARPPPRGSHDGAARRLRRPT